MSGRIFVHIGLPKTATTTLQREFFPALANDEIRYLGVFQPRGESQNHLYTRLREAVSTGSLLEEVRYALQTLLDTEAAVVVSEETFLSSSKDASWRMRLRNLGEILRGLDYILILTVREPTAAIFSYYVELNEKFSREKKDFLDLAKYDERMHIFHYQKLIDEIFTHFERDRIFVKQFEEVVQGQIEDLHRLVTSERQDWNGFQPKNHNNKNAVGEIVYTGRTFTLADLARRFFILLGILDTQPVITIKKRLAPIVRWMDNVALTKWKVSRRPKEEMEQLKEYLREETAALETHFGIRYE